MSLQEGHLTKLSFHIKKEGRWFHLRVLSTPRVARGCTFTMVNGRGGPAAGRSDA